MKKISFTIFACLFTLAALLSMDGYAKDKKDKDKKSKPKETATASADLGSYASQLPDFKLNDPAGKTWTKDSAAKDGVVLVVTAPTLKSKDAQEGWDKYLHDAKSGSKAKIVYIEDMQPSAFKGKALKGMKKDYQPGKEPILLIDNSGKVRSGLKVAEKQTVLLVYNNDGKLVYASADKPSPGAAAAAFEKVK